VNGRCPDSQINNKPKQKQDLLELDKFGVSHVEAIVQTKVMISTPLLHELFDTRLTNAVILCLGVMYDNSRGRLFGD